MSEEENQVNSGKKLIRTGSDLAVPLNAKEEKYRKRNRFNCDANASQINCTRCGKNIEYLINRGDNIKLHPLLQVLLCPRCSDYYGDGGFSMDEDNEDKYCRWCGEGGIIYLCSRCTCGFCPKCIRRHFGRETIERIKEDDQWQCYICKPDPLWQLRNIAAAAAETAKTRGDEIGMKKRTAAAAANKKDTPASILADSEGSASTKYDRPDDVKIKQPNAKRFVKLCRYLKQNTSLCSQKYSGLLNRGKATKSTSHLKLLCESVKVLEDTLEKLTEESRKVREELLALPEDEPKKRKRKSEHDEENNENADEDGEGEKNIQKGTEENGGAVMEMVTPKKRKFMNFDSS